MQPNKLERSSDDNQLLIYGVIYIGFSNIRSIRPRYSQI
jgi:hypothetical protein